MKVDMVEIQSIRVEIEREEDGRILLPTDTIG
jgi:hypothetical protein